MHRTEDQGEVSQGSTQKARSNVYHKPIQKGYQERLYWGGARMPSGHGGGSLELLNLHARGDASKH